MPERTEPGSAGGPGIDARSRLLLSLAAVAVAFAAADTYVVVLALPDMMASAGLSSDELQRAAPLISGFLLGYVGALPLIGRIADLRGRTPVLIGSLAVFAVGSLVTAAAYDLPSMVVGRLVQGVGGGGLVPATLALVADLWPVHRRGLPLGVVGAVQELGAVLGPLFGAAVLAMSDWRAIFWLNLAVAMVLIAAIVAARSSSGARPPPSTARPDWLGALLAMVTLIVLGTVLRQPEVLVTDVTWGVAFLPVAGDSRWLTPLALGLYALLAAFVVRQLLADRPLLAWRQWRATLQRTDLLGGVLLAIALAGVIIAFASADPEVATLSTGGWWWLLLGAAGAVAFAWRQTVSRHPLVPRGSLGALAARGAIGVSFFVGAALIAALVDIPFFARLTIYGDSQLDAALVLVRFLAALPVGAVLGGVLTRRISAGPLTAAGMALAAGGFVWMSSWGPEALRSPVATVPLVLAGLGFGLALAPVNASLLAVTRREVHGIVSALLVVARMVGMLVGISVLTTLGLRRFYAVAQSIPAAQTLCPDDPTSCPEYGEALRLAGLEQLEVVFVGAAVCSSLAAILALIVFRQTSIRSASSS